MITLKIVAHNQFNRSEIFEFLGGNGTRSFGSYHSQDPNNKNSVNLDSILQITGWSSDQLEASFSDFYFPTTPSVFNHELSTVPLYKSVQYCSECAADGVHLLFHQMHDCVRCPIHESLLSRSCPKCLSPIHKYSYGTIDPLPFSCGQCHWKPWIVNQTPSNECVERRLKKIYEFRTWIKLIQSTLEGENDNRFLMTGPARFQNLAHVHTIIPGPAWIEDCLFEGVYLAQNTYVLQERLKLPESCDVIKASDNKSRMGHKTYISSCVSERTELNIKTLDEKVKKTCDNLNLSGVGLDMSPASGLRLSHNERTSIFRTGSVIWQLWADAHRVSYIKSIWNFKHFVGCTDGFRQAWHAGPGLLEKLNMGKCESLDAACLRGSSVWESSIVQNWLTLLTVRWTKSAVSCRGVL